uniref:Ubiquitinyl hydrolase 1 n=2 Tax=Heterosigma akashiwo TaxID=2829 RepID=A0A6S9IZW9_HETAK
MVASLVAMGFSENGCRRACLATQNANVEVAMNWVLEHMGDPDFNDPPPPGFGAPPPAAAATAASSSGGNADAASPEEDGVGTYTLHGFVSHVGRNTASGHYVCHLRSADGSWAIFDDQKVAQSRAPPLRLGYLYFYRRDDAPAVEDP